MLFYYLCLRLCSCHFHGGVSVGAHSWVVPQDHAHGHVHTHDIFMFMFMFMLMSVFVFIFMFMFILIKGTLARDFGLLFFFL
jgi:hypothetical protein